MHTYEVFIFQLLYPKTRTKTGKIYRLYAFDDQSIDSSETNLWIRPI
jgi:hypothetical protein